MKLIIISILLALMGGTAFVVFKTGNKTTVTEISILRDITETHLAQPLPEEIMSLFDLNIHKWNGGIFRFANISDVSYTNTKYAAVTSANEWLSNQYDREKEIKVFRDKVEEIIADAKNDSIGKPHSSVYIPIADELNRLNKSHSQRRVLLIYSDLMENETTLSFYNGRVLELLKSNPDSAIKVFNKLSSLGNLSGIEVHIIYQPTNTETDRIFQIVSEFYRKYLESKGAKVEISANLI